MSRLLMIPLDGEAGDGAEEVRFGTEALEMLDRLADKHVGLLAGPVAAQEGYEGLLARLAVLAHALAGLRLLALDVQEIVGDLEREADIAGVAAKAGAGLRRHSAHDRAGLQAE